MNIQAPSAATQYERDDKLFEDTHTRTNADLLAFAARKSGMSTFALGKDFMRFGRSARGIEMGDYVRHSLWDRDRHGPDGADRYVGGKTHWPFVHTVNQKEWFNVAEDKLVMGTMIASAGLRQPETVAFIDASARVSPGHRKVDGPEALRDVVTSFPAGSLFLKTVGGMVGQGAMVVEQADATSIKCTGNDPMTYADFLAQVIGDRAYLIQKRLENHPDIAPFLSGIATIRFPNFMRKDGPLNPCVVMKLPSNGNVTCAFWRPGNLAAEIDMETGRIVRIAHRNGPVTEAIDDHPDRAGLQGLQLPFWKEVRELNDQTARLFAPIAYNSTDIALTPDGPVLVEANYGGSFDILQNGSGRGLLTDEMIVWFREHGIDLSGAPKPKKKKLGFF